jgi:hypothetical protein
LVQILDIVPVNKINARVREDAIDKYLEEMAKHMTPEQRKNMKINIKLTRR